MNSDINPNDINETQTDPRDAATAETGAESKPTGYCRVCGKALSASEAHLAQGTIFCAEHAPAPPPSEQTPPPPPNSDWARGVTDTSAISPGLAFLLGLIPGVGAIYNAQYAKGLIHVVIFGLIISILSSGGAEGLFVPLLIGWIFYMPFEAYHTAKKRQHGETVDEFSSLIPMKSSTSSLAGPVILIVAGAFFLLVNLDLIRLYEVVRFWPVLLIALGAWMLYSRRMGGGDANQ